MNSMMIAVVVSYTVGTVLGLFWGWNKGVENGSAATMKMLVENNFLNTHTVDDQLVILPFTENSETLHVEELYEPEEDA